MRGYHIALGSLCGSLPSTCQVFSAKAGLSEPRVCSWWMRRVWWVVRFYSVPGFVIYQCGISCSGSSYILTVCRTLCEYSVPMLVAYLYTPGCDLCVWWLKWRSLQRDSFGVLRWEKRRNTAQGKKLFKLAPRLASHWEQLGYGIDRMASIWWFDQRCWKYWWQVKNKVLQGYGISIINYDHESEANSLRCSRNQFPWSIRHERTIAVDACQ